MGIFPREYYSKLPECHLLLSMEIVEIVEWVSNFLNVPCALAVQVVLGFQVSEVMTMCNEAWLGFYKWSRNHFHQFQFLVVVAAWVLSGEAEGSGLYH